MLKGTVLSQLLVQFWIIMVQFWIIMVQFWIIMVKEEHVDWSNNVRKEPVGTPRTKRTE